MRRRKFLNISNSFNQPIFTENIIESNFYSELQKNSWCEIVEDKPEKLVRWVKILKSPKPD